MNRFCNDTGVGIMPWSPLFGGRLARPLGYDKSIRSQMKGPMSPAFTEADEEIIRRVEEVAGKKGWSMTRVGLLGSKPLTVMAGEFVLYQMEA